jgi:hypothetical protein
MRTPLPVEKSLRNGNETERPFSTAIPVSKRRQWFLEEYPLLRVFLETVSWELETISDF